MALSELTIFLKLRRPIKPPCRVIAERSSDPYRATSGDAGWRCSQGSKSELCKSKYFKIGISNRLSILMHVIQNGFSFKQTKMAERSRLDLIFHFNLKMHEN